MGDGGPAPRPSDNFRGWSEVAAASSADEDRHGSTDGEGDSDVGENGDGVVALDDMPLLPLVLPSRLAPPLLPSAAPAAPVSPWTVKMAISCRRRTKARM